MSLGNYVWKRHGRDREDNIVVGVGDLFSWKTLGGERFAGRIVEMDSNVAIVDLNWVASRNDRGKQELKSVEL